jgi:uncharacterized membrane protein YecN with MAPEG domain
MAKLTAWLVTLVGVLLLIDKPVLGLIDLSTINTWLIPLIVLIIGIGKLTRNYGKKK